MSIPNPSKSLPVAALGKPTISFSTADCKTFLEHLYPDTEKSDWKRVRKYKGTGGEVLRDFECGPTHKVTLQETPQGLLVVSSLVGITLAEKAGGYEGGGAVLKHGDAELTMRHYLKEEIRGLRAECKVNGDNFDDHDLNLLNSGPDTDDAGNPVVAYYFEFDARNYAMFVYPDDSWGVHSD